MEPLHRPLLKHLLNIFSATLNLISWVSQACQSPFCILCPPPANSQNRRGPLRLRTLPVLSALAQLCRQECEPEQKTEQVDFLLSTAHQPVVALHIHSFCIPRANQLWIRNTQKHFIVLNQAIFSLLLFPRQFCAEPGSHNTGIVVDTVYNTWCGDGSRCKGGEL